MRMRLKRGCQGRMFGGRKPVVQCWKILQRAATYRLCPTREGDDRIMELVHLCPSAAALCLVLMVECPRIPVGRGAEASLA